jgi:hypothetical protein
MFRTAAPSSYWIGMLRSSAAAPWIYTSGDAVGPLAANSPYQHWTPAQPVRNSNNPSDNCVQALLASSYDWYLGGEQYEAQVNTSLYNSGSTDAVAGWQSAGCATSMEYVCQVPAATFACYPPPNPPGPPPSPPSPPSPPMPPTCEWHMLHNSRLCSMYAHPACSRWKCADAGRPMGLLCYKHHDCVGQSRC